MIRTAIMIAGLSAGLAVAAAAQDATLSVAESGAFGPHIVGPGGAPVYIFVTDQEGGDNLPPLESCNQPCREDWPLVTVPNGFAVAKPLDTSLATTVEWDGQTVAQYDSQPLFRYAGDEPGAEPAGHGIHTYGGWWYLVGPDGEALPSQTPAANGG